MKRRHISMHQNDPAQLRAIGRVSHEYRDFWARGRFRRCDAGGPCVKPASLNQIRSSALKFTIRRWVYHSSADKSTQFHQIRNEMFSPFARKALTPEKIVRLFCEALRGRVTDKDETPSGREANVLRSLFSCAVWPLQGARAAFRRLHRPRVLFRGDTEGSHNRAKRADNSRSASRWNSQACLGAEIRSKRIAVAYAASCLMLAVLFIVNCAFAKPTHDTGDSVHSRWETLQPRVQALLSDGTAYLHKRDYKPAVDVLSAAVKADPACYECLQDLARAHGGLGQYAAALEDVTRLIKLTKHRDETQIYNRAALNYRLKHYSAAIEDATEAIRIGPKDAQAFVVRGSSSCALGRFRAAIQDLNRAVEINPDWPSFWLSRGLCRQKAGDLTNARADLEKAMRLYDERGYKTQSAECQRIISSFKQKQR